nr:MAG TPA: hypothetical protein [Caudoviricetes sp.]
MVRFKCGSSTDLTSDLYLQNRLECRTDVDEFQEKVWTIEDDLLNEVEEQA